MSARARKKSHAQVRHEHEAPAIEPPASPTVFLPLTLSASVAFASQLDSEQARYSNHRYLRGAVVGGVLGHLIQRGLQ
jgi:hypothetical protein